MGATDQAGRSGVARSFDVVSRFYDHPLLQRVAYRPNHDAVVAELGRLGARRVLDVGCGTGILTVRIHDELHPEVVIGCDASEGMLERARERSGDVDWRRGAAERLPLEDGSVDAVITTEAFHFFDKPRALREFHRVLEPGGHVLIAVITPTLPVPGIVEAVGPAGWPTRRQLRGLLQRAGFDVVAQRSVRPRLGRLWPGAITVGRR